MTREVIGADSETVAKTGGEGVARNGAVAEAGHLDLVSPKQPGPKSRRDWYPYYAGFTERFAEAVIDQYFDRAASVIDPWSGSGTTTVTCLRRGMQSRGIDINPAVTVVARARLNAISMKARLLELGARIVERASLNGDARATGELLDEWMTPAGVLLVRGVRKAIHEVVHEPEPAGATDGNLGVDQLSAEACFLYCGLFGAVRRVLGRYGTTNPMWLKPAGADFPLITPSADSLLTSFAEQLGYLAERLSLRSDQVPMADSVFDTGHADRTGAEGSSYDAVLTSPPYATRVDYIKGMLPELAVLGADQVLVRELRRRSTGRPTVDGDRARVEDVRSALGRTLLDAIASHKSKGSSSYYFPWMTNYLISLQSGLEEIDRIVKEGGVIAVVVQDSYYKELHVDLQGIVTEVLLDMGRPMPCRHDYSAANPRRGLPLSGGQDADEKKAARESLLVFKGKRQG